VKTFSLLCLVCWPVELRPCCSYRILKKQWTVLCAGWIDVAWDAGGTNSYRMGAEGKYDLMLAPSHNPEKTRKDLLSPRSLNKAKGLTVDGADGKNKVNRTYFI